MKHYTWIFMMAGLLAIPSCSSDSPTENIPTENEKPAEKEEKVSSITAVLPAMKNMSRAQINPGSPAADEKSVYWNKGDQINLQIGQSKHLLNIDPSYDETQSEGNRTAKFLVTENITPTHYLAVYPTDVRIDEDTIFYDNSLEEMDFTSAKTPKEKAKVWRESMSKNMLYHSEGILKSGDETVINFQQQHATLSFTYTNYSGKERKIDALYVSGINFGTVWVRRSSTNEIYGWSYSSNFLLTKGLTMADGESMDFYFHFYGTNSWLLEEGGHLLIEYADGLPVDHVNKERDLVEFQIETMKETHNLPNRIRAGERYHFDVVETPIGLFWDLPKSGVSITIENKELSYALHDYLGSYFVQLDNNGYAQMDETHLKNIKFIKVDYEYSISSLAGIGNFINLENLQCGGTGLNNCNLTENQKLRYIYLSDNNLTQLDVSNLSLLEDLWCSNNQIEYLDISSLSNLINLQCGNQKDNITLKLKLSEAQKEKWKNEWSKDPTNQNVILVND